MADARWLDWPSRADVAELVDAHGSGPCGLRLVEVQVLSSAFAQARPFASTLVAMKFVRVAVIGCCALLATCVGVARATTGGGGTIATAPSVTPGVPVDGDTSSNTDSCTNGFEFWKLQLRQGDLVKIMWGDTAAVDKLALWPADTTDTAYGASCVYDPTWSGWNVSPVLADSNGTPGTPLTSHTVVNADGTYPLLFVNTTGVNAGAYSFTAVVRHAASVSFSRQSAIRGTGTFTASVLAPDASSISDAGLKLTLNGFWSSHAGAAPHRHILATATPTNGIVAFDYSLPPSLWGTKIRLDISGGGASYQPVMSQRESVKVLIPLGVPVVASAKDLKATSKLLRQPIYWAGPRKGFHYELTRSANGWTFVRYLPHGVKAGGAPGKHLIVATYPYRGAYAGLKKYANGKAVAGPNGSIYFVLPGKPTSVYVAFPKVNYEIEVYDPSPAVARSIAATGQVVPVG